jgi:hypothetical protein
MQYGSQPRRCSPASNPFTLSLEGPRSAPRTRTTFNLQLSTACPEPRGGRPLSMAPLFSSTYALLARSFALPFRATSPESARYALFPRNTRDIYPQSEHPAKVRSRDSGGVHKDSGAGDVRSPCPERERRECAFCIPDGFAGRVSRVEGPTSRPSISQHFRSQPPTALLTTHHPLPQDSSLANVSSKGRLGGPITACCRMPHASGAPAKRTA